MWTLIVISSFVPYVTSGHGDFSAASTASVPGFHSQQLCEAALNLWASQMKALQRSGSGFCVAMQ
jgi:hypothetical protein